MDILNELSLVPVSYWIGLAMFAIILTLWVLARLYTVKEGIFIQAINHINNFFHLIGQEITVVWAFCFGTVSDALDEFLVNERNFKFTGKLSVFVWSGIMISGLIVSYSSQRAWFIDIGMPQNLATWFPVVVDAVIIGATIHSGFEAYGGEQERKTKLVIYTYTFVSIYLNVIHLRDLNQSLQWFQYLIGAGVSPLGVFIGSELVSKSIMKMTYREGLYKTDADLRDQISTHRAEKKAIESELSEARILRDQKMPELIEQRDTLTVELDALRKELETVNDLVAKADAHFKDAVPNSQGRIDQVRLLAEAGNTPQQVAETLGISEKSARSYYRSAQTNGVS